MICAKVKCTLASLSPDLLQRAVITDVSFVREALQRQWSHVCHSPPKETAASVPSRAHLREFVELPSSLLQARVWVVASCVFWLILMGSAGSGADKQI